LATSYAQVDPDAGEATQQQMEIIARNLMVSLEKLDPAAEKHLNGDNAKPLQSVLQVAGIAQALRSRPLLLLLLEDRSSAEQAERRLLEKRTTVLLAPEVETARLLLTGAPPEASKANLKRVEDGLSLALYYIATGAYGNAIQELKPLPGLVRNQDVSQVFQVEYLLAMCYRRTGDRTAEMEILRAGIEDLEKLRRSLHTRNQAIGLQSLRQMMYEEYLGGLFSQKRYAQMAEAMRQYKRSNQMPISVLFEIASTTQI